MPEITIQSFILQNRTKVDLRHPSPTVVRRRPDLLSYSKQETKGIDIRLTPVDEGIR